MERARRLKLLLPPIGRPDGVIVDGSLRIFELNLDSGVAGYIEVDRMQQRLEELAVPGTRVPRIVPAISAYVRDLAELRGGGALDVAILVDRHLGEYDLGQARIMADILAGGAGDRRVRVVTPRDLRRSQGALRDDQGFVDILWRFGSLTHPASHVADLIQIQLAALDTRTWVVSQPTDLGVESKLALALLSSAADNGAPGLSEGERALVRRVVPWTRVLLPGELEFRGRSGDTEWLACASRESLVLKRSNSKSSTHAFIGRETPPTAWRERVRAALADPIPWVLQESLESAALPFASFEGVPLGLRTVRRSYRFSPFVFGDAEVAPLVQIEGDPTARLQPPAVTPTLVVHRPPPR